MTDRSAVVLDRGDTRLGPPEAGRSLDAADGETRPDAPDDAPCPLARTVETLAALAEDVVVVTSPGRRSAVRDALSGDETAAVDASADRNVLAALRTGCRFAGGQRVAVARAGADVDETLVDRLFEACETAALPRLGDHLYPLAAVYDRAALRRASDRTLATGSRRLSDGLARLDAVETVDAPELERNEAGDAPNPDVTTPAGVVRG